MGTASRHQDGDVRVLSMKKLSRTTRGTTFHAYQVELDLRRRGRWVPLSLTADSHGEPDLPTSLIDPAERIAVLHAVRHHRKRNAAPSRSGATKSQRVRLRHEILTHEWYSNQVPADLIRAKDVRPGDALIPWHSWARHDVVIRVLESPRTSVRLLVLRDGAEIQLWSRPSDEYKIDMQASGMRRARPAQGESREGVFYAYRK